jgi:transposase
METFQVPRRRVTECLGIAKSTLYRWLHKIEEQTPSRTPANKTPLEIASLVWEITKANVSWGRVRIANQLALLNLFLAASTVRNIINQPKPRKTPKSSPKPKEVQDEARSIPAWYPNHVWSIDTTMVFCLKTCNSVRNHYNNIEIEEDAFLAAFGPFISASK